MIDAVMDDLDAVGVIVQLIDDLVLDILRTGYDPVGLLNILPEVLLQVFLVLLGKAFRIMQKRKIMDRRYEMFAPDMFYRNDVGLPVKVEGLAGKSR
jgi:K+-transporting ATPase A subunit